MSHHNKEVGQSKLPAEESRASRFDRGFVGAAIAIGFAYCLLVVVIGKLLGKEAAGIAGAALTAVVVALLREFETLRFRKVAAQEGREIQIPKISVWYLLLATAAIAGIAHSLELFLSPILGRISPMVTDPDASMSEAMEILISSPKFLVLMGLIRMFAYFIGGVFCGRMAPNKRYTYAILAALIHLIFTLVLFMLPAILYDISALPDVIMTALWPMGIFWLVLVVAALAGSHLGFRLSNNAHVRVSSTVIDSK